MTYAGYMWQCQCTHITYGEEAPEECIKCGRMDSFIRLPEELAAEREKDLADEFGLNSHSESEDLEEVKPPRKKIKIKSRNKKKK